MSRPSSHPAAYIRTGPPHSGSCPGPVRIPCGLPGASPRTFRPAPRRCSPSLPRLRSPASPRCISRHPARVNQRIRCRSSGFQPARCRSPRRAGPRPPRRRAIPARSVPSAARIRSRSAQEPFPRRKSVPSPVCIPRPVRCNRCHTRGSSGGYNPPAPGRTPPRWPPSESGSGQTAYISSAPGKAGRYRHGTGSAVPLPADNRGRSAGTQIHPAPRQTRRSFQNTGHQNSRPLRWRTGPGWQTAPAAGSPGLRLPRPPPRRSGSRSPGPGPLPRNG